MCGFAGYFSAKEVTSGRAILLTMAEEIIHRGPDDSGAWLDEGAGIGLAHRRLSVLDLSSAGHQPMVSSCGRYVLVYNGEIYNHAELREELHREGGCDFWRGHSDTETLLYSLRHWGIEVALEKLNGMFSFALWDKCERTLFLARDRMGEKPLYYGRSGNVLLFASELKALTAHPEWRGEIDRSALALYLRYSYVPSPWSIYKNIYKLPPAHYVVIREQGAQISEPRCYWDLGRVAKSGEYSSMTEQPAVMVDTLEALLRDVVRRRMSADVPLGAFLSGGYDSSTITALMQDQSSRPVKTYSIGFYDETHNEAKHAKAVAKHLGTEHTEFYITAKDAMAIIPRLPMIYDEPFSDSSQIPTCLVSQLARRHVTVALSGDGGDELFCGYNRYVMGYRVWNKLCMFPSVIRQVLRWFLNRVPGHALDKIQSALPQKLRVSSLSDRLPKLAEVLAYQDGKSFYRGLVSHWKEPEQVVLGACEPGFLSNLSSRTPDFESLRDQMMYLDMLTYLPDDLLTKVDRASMAVGLETRVPFLDHRLIELAWKIPFEYKYRNGEGKWLLRQVLYRYVPRSLIDRPKMGFGVPIEHWLRGPLRDWSEALLDEKYLREAGFFQPAPIRKKWQEYISGKGRWHYHLWDILMFQSWLEQKNASSSISKSHHKNSPIVNVDAS